ncbi:MAG TPA: TRAM domain-containing protein [Chthoniobacterales bacterium]|jgi:23S rRNA (uracil1939-C5)-methyltransferase|nr:TRAM domain-containing protein [Chthoniobacterales bacterium]
MPQQAKTGQNPGNERLVRDLQIDEVAFGGAGVGRSDGKVIFVPFTVDREIVDVRLHTVRRSYSLGQVEAIRQPSPHRIVAPCPFFQNCGGCDYQHITYAHQLAIKQGQIEQALRRIAKLSGCNVRPIKPSPKPFGYRNRISVHSDGRNIGFFQKGTRNVVDISHCLLASETVNARLSAFRAARPPAGAHATLRENEDITTFSQTNDEVARLLVEFVQSQVKGPVLIDGYCGSGFFAHHLAAVVDKVIGIDWNQPAIQRAQEMATPNETYLCGDLSELLDRVLITEKPDTVILDPSATGLSEEIVAILASHVPPSLIYVSCNPATFARDLKRLSNRFQVQEIQPFDMFPQTAEIEVVGILRHS